MMRVSTGFLLCGAIVILCTGSAAASEATENGADDPFDPFGWFSRMQEASEKEDGMPAIARVLVLMAALQATDPSTAAGGNIIKLLGQQSAASTRTLADKLGKALGSDYASYQPGNDDSNMRGAVNINLGGLLDLDTDDLDQRLAAAAQLLTGTSQATQPAASTPAGGGPASGAGTSNQPETATSPTGSLGDPADVANQYMSQETQGQQPDLLDDDARARRRVLLQAKGSPPPGKGGSPPAKNGSSAAAAGKSSSPPAKAAAPAKKQPAERVIRNSSISIVGTDESPLAALTGIQFNGSRLLDKKKLLNRTRITINNKTLGVRAGQLRTALKSALGVDWAALQEKVQSYARDAYDRALLNKPRIKGENKLEQIFQVVVDRLTSGKGLAEGCTPYVFNGGNRPLPETIIFPSFSISQTTGNCVLIPEFIGNVEYPGQWSLLNERVACLGPATEYLQVPAFYRKAASSSESFTCPTCRNEFSIGPDVTFTLVGDQRKTVKYRNRAEFLAALKTNKTFGFGAGGLDAAVELFRKKLNDKKEVLSRHLNVDVSVKQQQSAEGVQEDLLGGLSSWIAKTWGTWQEGAADTLNNGAVRHLLQEHMEGEDPMGQTDPLEWGRIEQQMDQWAGSLFPDGTEGPPVGHHEDEGDGTAAQQVPGDSGTGGGDGDSESEEEGQGWQATLAKLLSKARVGLD